MSAGVTISSIALLECPNWHKVLNSDAPSLFICVARPESAAMDEEWILHEVEIMCYTS